MMKDVDGKEAYFWRRLGTALYRVETSLWTLCSWLIRVLAWQIRQSCQPFGDSYDIEGQWIQSLSLYLLAYNFAWVDWLSSVSSLTVDRWEECTRVDSPCDPHAFWLVPLNYPEKYSTTQHLAHCCCRWSKSIWPQNSSITRVKGTQWMAGPGNVRKDWLSYSMLKEKIPKISRGSTLWTNTLSHILRHNTPLYIQLNFQLNKPDMLGAS